MTPLERSLSFPGAGKIAKPAIATVTTNRMPRCRVGRRREGPLPDWVRPTGVQPWTHCGALEWRNGSLRATQPRGAIGMNGLPLVAPGRSCGLDEPVRAVPSGDAAFNFVTPLRRLRQLQLGWLSLTVRGLKRGSMGRLGLTIGPCKEIDRWRRGIPLLHTLAVGKAATVVRAQHRGIVRSLPSPSSS